MIKLIIDSNKNLKKAATSKVFVGENEFEEITVSCNRRVLVNNISDFSASLRVVIGENELSYPLAFSDTDSNTMTATVLIDTRMTRAVAELQFYVKFNSGEKVGMTNAIKIECKPNIESNGDEPYIPPIPLDDFVPRAQTIAGIDQYDAITAEELKAALDIEVSDGAKVFFEIFAPPYYVSDNDYCKIGDIWVDKDISTGQGYRVSVLMSKIYISDPGVYYCSWQPVVPASFNINVLPGGGNLPVYRYSETGGNTEYSYPPYRNGDILTVNGSDYECSVSDGSSYSSTYTYSFKRAVSEADITGKMSLIPINPTAEEIEAMPSGQLYSDENSHKGIIKGGQEFYDSTYVDENLQRKTYFGDGRPECYGYEARLKYEIGDRYYCESDKRTYVLNQIYESAVPPMYFYEWGADSPYVTRIDGVIPQHYYTGSSDLCKYVPGDIVFQYNSLSSAIIHCYVLQGLSYSTGLYRPGITFTYRWQEIAVPYNYYTKGETNTLLNTKENTSNKVTSLSSSSTDDQYPTAKCVYDELADKADSATTLAGYGIANAYTKTETDTLLSNKMDLAPSLMPTENEIKNLKQGQVFISSIPDIAIGVKTAAAGTAGDKQVYTTTYIDNMIGNIETALSEV